MKNVKFAAEMTAEEGAIWFLFKDDSGRPSLSRQRKPVLVYFAGYPTFCLFRLGRKSIEGKASERKQTESAASQCSLLSS